MKTIHTVLAVAVLSASNVLAQGADTAPASADPRPVGRTLGIGVGWAFPQDLLNPNVVSVRFRQGKITIEPRLTIGGARAWSSTESTRTLGTLPPQESFDGSTDGGLELSAEANVRCAIAKRGPVDLVGIAGVNASTRRSTQEGGLGDADQSDITRTTTTQLGLGAGLGLEYYFGRGIALSLDAQNPLVAYSTSVTTRDVLQRVAGQDLRDQETERTQGFSYALTFRPTLRAMVHMYF